MNFKSNFFKTLQETHFAAHGVSSDVAGIDIKFEMQQLIRNGPCFHLKTSGNIAAMQSIASQPNMQYEKDHSLSRTSPFRP